jgi:predicted acyl esterase
VESSLYRRTKSKAGHRIDLEISSSTFPKFDRNLNTGAPLGMTSEMAVAQQRIYHDAEHPSAVVLFVIPREDNSSLLSGEDDYF